LFVLDLTYACLQRTEEYEVLLTELISRLDKQSQAREGNTSLLCSSAV
jgi:hypothetical protein